jgi:copper chaperone CopZ
MATPEHAYAHEVPSYSTHCVECPSAAELACNARYQAGSCCQIAQGSSNAPRLAISHQDRSCLGSRQSQNIECHQGISGCLNARALAGAHSLTAEDDCSSDCAPSGQAGLIPSGPNADREDNVVAASVECACCDCSPKRHSARGQSCPIPTGSIADNENNVAAATAEDDCCSECTLNCHPARGQVYPVDAGPDEKEDTVVISTVNTRESIQLSLCCVSRQHFLMPTEDGSSECCCKGHPNADHFGTSGTSIQDHLHPCPCARISRNATCHSKATPRRLSEVACCCLGDWRVRSPKQRHHHHHSHSQLSRPRPEAKNTEDAAEKGIGGLQTILLAVKGMSCPSCATKVTRALLKLPSVQDVKVNTLTGQASLTYREGFIFPSTIANRVTKATGFVCVVVDEPRLEGKHRILYIKFQTTTVLPPVLPPGVVILKASRTEFGVVFEIQYDAAVIQPRSVLGIFGPLGGSFLPPSKSNASAQVTTEVTSLFRRTLMSAVLSIPVMVFSWAPLQPHPIVYGAISLFLATCIQFGVGAPLYYTAFYTLIVQHILDMDVLVALSSTIAYVLSLVGYTMQVAGHEFTPPFFETPTLLLTLITLGELISAYSRRRVTSALDGLGTLQPDLVQMVSADGATATATHVDLVQPHDVLRVAPNTLIPTDGIVLQGSTQVDESALTGESLPVDKALGAPLTAGTRNLTSSIDMKVNRAPAENTLAEFSAFLARLQEARLPVQDLSDRAAALLAPAILAVAVVVFVIWIVVGLCVRGEHLAKAGLAALRYTISVMVVSCPCAVVLCVPMVIVTTGAVASREGVLLKVCFPPSSRFTVLFTNSGDCHRHSRC